MASTSKGTHLQPLSTHWHTHNRSLSNISATSDTATFHSAHDHPHMELHPLSQPTPSKPLSPKLSAIKMSRQDSSSSDPRSSTSTPRTSSSSTRPKAARLSKASSSRPSGKRASTSRASPSTAQQIRTSASGSRPSLSSRHTTSYIQPTQQNQYQFFQFPVPELASHPDPNPDPDPAMVLPPPPPATVQYWTSDSTRRLEYAAIDAAGSGLRGFFIRLVPDCILPPESRRTRFAQEEGSECGSVRRYRLVLPEEKGCVGSVDEGESGSGSRNGEGRSRPSLLRRLTGFGKGRYEGYE